MPKNQCCCVKRPNPPFCCNPIFFKEFITLFGQSMAEHAEVSPDDWISLYVQRPSQHTNDVRRWGRPGQQCNCCCGGCPNEQGGYPSGFKSAENRSTFLNKFKNIVTGLKSDQSKLNNIESNPSGYNKNFMGNEGDGECTDPKGCADTGPGLSRCPGGTQHAGAPLPCFVDVNAWCEGGIQDINDPRHVHCMEGCCTEDRYRTVLPGAEPIFFAYKYSGCNLIWYPREFSFGKDPYVPQCNGFLTMGENGSRTQNSCSPWSYKRTYAGGAFDTWPYECQIPEKTASDVTMPCTCTLYPHIHGGVRDSVFNRVNVSTSTGELGYLPYMMPLSEPMLSAEESGCCWCACAGTPGAAYDVYQKNRKTFFANVYPFVDQKGKTVSQTATVAPGINCYYFPNDLVGLNPNYRRSCYEWGISPYLMRISKDKNKMGYEIWRHGRTPEYVHDFGPLYVATRATANTNSKEWEISFKKISGRKSTLKQQYIGFVQLEHKFECYAYRSDDGSNTIDLLGIQNNANMLVPPFERGYAGSFSGPIYGNVYKWNPYKFSSNMWQIRRGVPRRVTYIGSGIPLFHFDLVAMENLSRKDPSIIGPGGSSFEGTTFLEHYYRYFHSMQFFDGSGCKEVGDPPEPFEFNFTHLLDSYQYVVGWLELMITHGILRIKDHAIDISSDVNKIIEQGGYVTNEQGEEELVISDSVALETGGIVEYQKILDLFEVRAGTKNATTPKTIKQKLLNTNGLEGFTGPSGDRESFRCFLPRRAKLQLASARGGVTGWGCESDSATTTETSYDGLSCAAYVQNVKNVPDLLRPQPPESVFSIMNPVKAYCGLASGFVVDRSGKLTAWGNTEPPFDGPCAEFPVQTQYPESTSCIPYYLDSFGLFLEQGDGNIVANPQGNIPDGKIIDLACLCPNFVAALCEFDHSALGFACAYGQEPVENLSYEIEESAQDGGEEESIYQRYNCNGVNVAWLVNNYVCMKNEPFQIVQTIAGSQYGPRTANLGQYEKPDVPTYRIKSWGYLSRELGTFSLSREDAVKNFPRTDYRGYDEVINPDNLRYPGTNTWFIWTAIASGLAHFAALDDYGGLFVTANSSNDEGQTAKGRPLPYNSIYNSNPEMGWSDMYHGWESHFNYFNHIPRPGFIYEEDWTQELYNSLTWIQSEYKSSVCSCPYYDQNCHPSGPGLLFGESNRCGGKVVTVKDEDGICRQPNPPVYDYTCTLMGSYVQGEGDLNRNWSDTQPRYTQLAAGHYNTMLLTNENRLEIYGTYFQINENGYKIGPKTIDSEGNEIIQGITAFIPEDILSLQGTWNLTHGCTFECDGVMHRPIIDYSYNRPSDGSLISIIKSSCDYSMCVTKNNQVHIWGDASMVPGKFNNETYKPGQTAYTIVTLPNAYDQNITIKDIAVGVNSFYVLYSLEIPGTDFTSDRMYSYTRYGKENFGTETPDNLQSKPIADVASGYNFAIAIYSEGLEAKTWDYQSFAPETEKYQYKNFTSLPAYFRRDAFFHAIQGSWDYTKWLYGGNCCGKLTDVDHPILTQDTCSAMAYNIYDDDPETRFNENLSYSGHPEYFWMKRSWRRYTVQSFEIVKDPDQPTSCNPDGGYAPGGEGLEIARAYGGCLSDVGVVWGESRPSANSIVRETQTPIEPSCIHTDEDNCMGALWYHNRGVIPADTAALSREYNFPPIIAYRATKDVFQSSWHRFGSSDWPSTTNNAVPCAKHLASTLSYFKYCERHYYFGYDRETDTYDIYLNPDFMRNIGTNGEIWVEPEPPASVGYTAIGQLPQNGFGGGTGPDGGTLAGICGYYSLYFYPMTGINYGREDWNYVPMYDLRNEYIVKSVQSYICHELNPDDSCYICLKPQGVGTVQFFGGPGAFVFMSLCSQAASFPNDPAPMWNPSVKYVPYYRTLAPKVMLKGIESIISQTVPPESDPDYIRYTFSDVLKSEDHTETITPWLYPSSTKWIPMFLEPPNITAFGGVNAEDPNSEFVTGRYVLRIYDQNGNVLYLTNPFLCSIFRCCGDPE